MPDRSLAAIFARSTRTGSLQFPANRVSPRRAASIPFAVPSATSRSHNERRRDLRAWHKHLPCCEARILRSIRETQAAIDSESQWLLGALRCRSARASGERVVAARFRASHRASRSRSPFGDFARQRYECSAHSLCSITIRISCRGRLQQLHAARNQDGGPGQLQPLDTHHGLDGMGREARPIH